MMYIALAKDILASFARNFPEKSAEELVEDHVYREAYLTVNRVEYVQLRKEWYAELAMTASVDWLDDSTTLTFEGLKVKVRDGVGHHPVYAEIEKEGALCGRLLFEDMQALLAYLLVVRR